MAGGLYQQTEHELPPDCVLTNDMERDCCGNEPLKFCRIFSGFSGLFVLLALSISIFLFRKQHLIAKKSTYNFYMHILINLTFLGTFRS